jgi:hypothetical protein
MKQPTPLKTDDTCTAANIREAEAGNLQAATDAKAYRLEDAAKKYAEAMKSCDPKNLVQAKAGYTAVNQTMEKWWWRWGKYIPGLRWWFEYPGESDWLTWKIVPKLRASYRAISSRLLRLLAFVLVGAWILWLLIKYGTAVLYAIAVFPFRARLRLLAFIENRNARWEARRGLAGLRWRAAAWLEKRDEAKPPESSAWRSVHWWERVPTEWILPFLGQARLSLPDKLNDNSEHELFRRELNAGMEDIRRCVKASGVAWIAGPTALLSLPSAVSSELVKDFPEFQGAKLGPILGWLFSLGSYFGWRAECGETYLEDSKSIVAFASLRWAWFTRKSWKVTTTAASKVDLNLAARTLALHILSARFDNRPPQDNIEFEDSQHFIVFMQGAYALQSYETIGNQSCPDRTAMLNALRTALEQFQRCVNNHPTHLLSKFYLATANVLVNQDNQVVPELGEHLRTLNDEALPSDSRPLTYAADYFKEIAASDDPSLRPMALYNWAKTLVKRERPASLESPADLDMAEEILRKLVKGLSDSSIDLAGSELVSLSIQCNILRDYIAVRKATPHFQPVPAYLLLPKAIPGLEDLRTIPRQAKALRELDPPRIFPREEIDLTTDSQSALGYVCYELARASRADNARRRKWLDEGDAALDESLRLKPGWTPAQINKLRITIERLRLLRDTAASPEEIAALRKIATDLLTDIQGREASEDPNCPDVEFAAALLNLS